MRDELPVKPVEEYLVNGPVPADQLMDLDFLEVYVEYVVDSRYDIHFMLERISTHGAPELWEGTVAEFEADSITITLKAIGNGSQKPPGGRRMKKFERGGSPIFPKMRKMSKRTNFLRKVRGAEIKFGRLNCL